jgi:glycosyltransferase involved in cell wall biosynthesis
MGTQEVTVQTIRALARRGDIEALVVYVPYAFSPQVDALRREFGNVTFVPVNPVVDQIVRTVDVIYRPYQVNSLAELDFLRFVADRFIVNQLDTIAFNDPAYFRDHDQWVAYRDVTRLTLQLAGGITFPSEYSRATAHAAGLLEAETPTKVVSCGIARPDPCADESEPDLGRAIRPGYLLCMGASYLHKNRRFVLDVWTELRRRGSNVQLVLAGPSPPFGNSQPIEAAFLLSHPWLRTDLVTLGSVTEEQKRWLFRRAGLVMYPSTVEGFGFVPFEAAAHNVPTLATRQGSLDEILPADLRTLTTFEVDPAADLVEELLGDPDRSREVIELLARRSADFSWESVAERFMNLAQEALRHPARRVLVIEGDHVEPAGVVGRGRIGTAATANALNRVVAAVIRRPALKRTLSPDGSGRQAMARRVIGTARRNIL